LSVSATSAVLLPFSANFSSFSSFNNKMATIPDAEKVRGLIHQLFTVNSPRGWILMGYRDPNTIVYEAHGTGPLSEITSRLQDDKVQYFIIRIPLDDHASHVAAGAEIQVSKTRDVMVSWTGPKVGMIEKGKKKSHLGAMTALLTPVHAELYAVNKANITEKVLKEKSEPHAGSHIID